MRIMHIALGGCLGGADVRFGLTEDTGGHLAYVLGAAAAQARRPDIAAVDLVTRAFDDRRHDRVHAKPETIIDAKRRILRIWGARRGYLEKDALEADIPALTRALVDLLRDRPRPDLIHAHFADAAELALAARRAYGIPFLYTPHSLARQKDAFGAGQVGRIARETRAIATADGIIASSQDETDRQIAAYGVRADGRTWCVAPGAEVDREIGVGPAMRLIRPHLRRPSKPVVLAIARPVRKKNLATLIDAFGHSQELRHAANLVILAGQRRAIGDSTCETGVVTTELFDRVDRQDLWGRVALPRTHTPGEVQSLYRLAARDGVFVNPAFHEPFGLTVVEAAQQGVPVVATSNGGPPEILESIGYGRTVDPNDRAAIADACLVLLRDPRREIRAEAGRARALRLYNWDRWAESVARIARRVLAKGSPAPAVPRPRQLLISDIDGTLTGDRAGVARLREYLRGAGDLGFAVATGRSVVDARRVLAEWDLPEPAWMITSVGSEIWCRSASGSCSLDTGFAQRIAGSWKRAMVSAVLEQAGARMQPAFAQRAFKVSALGDAAEADRLAAVLRRKGLRARVIASHGRFIDVLPVAAGKARAAAWLARGLGLSAAECIAAGDSGNDRDLLCWAGRAIVPANGLSEIADLDAPAIYRSPERHAAGVVDGLAAMRDLAVDRPRMAAE